jgi:hypothetical protein
VTAYGPSKAPPFPMHAHNRSGNALCSRCGIRIQVNATRDAGKPGFGVCGDCREADPEWVVATHDRQRLIPGRVSVHPPDWADRRRRQWAAALGTEDVG